MDSYRNWMYPMNFNLNPFMYISTNCLMLLNTEACDNNGCCRALHERSSSWFPPSRQKVCCYLEKQCRETSLSKQSWLHFILSIFCSTTSTPQEVLGFLNTTATLFVAYGNQIQPLKISYSSILIICTCMATRVTQASYRMCKYYKNSSNQKH